MSFVLLTYDGDVAAINTPGMLDDVRVRRGQALAALVPEGMTVVRSLLAAKLEGQASLLRDLGGQRQAAEAAREAARALGDATTIGGLRFIESRAAAIYWDAWTGLPMRFATRDGAKVPRTG